MFPLSAGCLSLCSWDSHQQLPVLPLSSLRHCWLCSSLLEMQDAPRRVVTLKLCLWHHGSKQNSPALPPGSSPGMVPQPNVPAAPLAAATAASRVRVPCPGWDGLMRNEGVQVWCRDAGLSCGGSGGMRRGCKVFTEGSYTQRKKQQPAGEYQKERVLIRDEIRGADCWS